MAGTKPSNTCYRSINRWLFLLDCILSSSNSASIFITDISSLDLLSPVINLASLLWILSSLFVSTVMQGSHTIAPYSMVDHTKEMYAVFLQFLGQFFRILLRKPSVELAFLVTCVVHLRSSDIWIQRYGLFCTCCMMWPLRLLYLWLLFCILSISYYFALNRIPQSLAHTSIFCKSFFK